MKAAQSSAQKEAKRARRSRLSTAPAATATTAASAAGTSVANNAGVIVTDNPTASSESAQAEPLTYMSNGHIPVDCLASSSSVAADIATNSTEDLTHENIFIAKVINSIFSVLVILYIFGCIHYESCIFALAAITMLYTRGGQPFEARVQQKEKSKLRDRTPEIHLLL